MMKSNDVKPALGVTVVRPGDEGGSGGENAMGVSASPSSSPNQS